MSEDDAGLVLAAEFHRLTEDEPPFRTSLAEALRAAEQDGRRRRNQTFAVRGGATVLALAASTALVLAWPNHPTSMAPPVVVVPTDVVTPTHAPTPSPVTTTPTPTRTTPGPSAASPTRPVTTTSPAAVTPTPTNATPSTPPLGTMARLERLVRQIAAPSGGVVTLPTRDAVEKSVVALVTTDRGQFEVSASVDAGPNDVATAREMCTNDGSTCTTQWSSESDGVWSRVYPSKPGRETLMLVATYPDTRSLWIKVDNYVEIASGAKVTGPTWTDVGITVTGVRQAEADAGLNVDRTTSGS